MVSKSDVASPVPSASPSPPIGSASDVADLDMRHFFAPLPSGGHFQDRFPNKTGALLYASATEVYVKQQGACSNNCSKLVAVGHVYVCLLLWS